MEIAGMIYVLIALFCAVSAILYIFVPFWIKRMMDTLLQIKKGLDEQNELIKQQLKLHVENLE